MKRLVLIDGNAILHRAYHALPPLTAPDGSLVNAVYGFTSMLLKLFTDLKPDYLAVAFDRPKPTFRKELYQDYQAKRPKMDEELAGQIDKVHEVVRAFGIPIYELDGYEADDVIGTIAQKAISKTADPLPVASHLSPHIDQVVIVTGDRDLLQLVADEQIYVYMPTKGLSEAKLYDEREVKTKLGVSPEQIPDYKALAGDASDNYPGVPGVGPKTAADLINRFGSIENLIKTVKNKAKAKLSKTLIEKLKEGIESAKLSRQLATIRTDVPLVGDPVVRPITTLDTPQVRQVLAELHFHSLLKRLTKPEEELPPKKDSQKEQRNSEQQQLF